MKREESWIELELQNWARWSVDRLGVGHCASIEHRYCAGYWGEDQGPVRQAQIPVDALRALACERAIVRLPRSPQPYAAVVRAHYLRRWPLDRATIVIPVGTVRYKMARRTYFRTLEQAQVMLKNLLTSGTKHSEIRQAAGSTAPNPIEARDRKVAGLCA